MLIPSREVVKFVLREVLQGSKVKSQAELAELVREKLKKSESRYAISEKRVRTIAAETPGIRIRIKTRKGRHPKRCPACGHKLKRVYTKNLRGRKILSALRCPRCSYRGSGSKWVPGRYEFGLSG
jgi:predicted RNA-binding Zn-ribbon protein involved in translation (DUF1610 family)